MGIEDSIHRIFGDGMVAVVLLWVVAAFVLLALLGAAVAWLWKRLSKLVNAAEFFGSLPAQFKEVTQAIAEQGVVLERVRAQVENDHQTNMREEQDERHDILDGKVDLIAEKLDAIDEKTDTAAMEIRGMKRDIGRQADRDERIEAKLDNHLQWSHTWSAEREAADQGASQRLDSLEQTLNPKKD